MKNTKKKTLTTKKAEKGGEFIAVESTTTKVIINNISDAVILKPLEVRVFGPVERALKIFRALVQKERILSKFKEKASFEKPSDKKRRKRSEMKRKVFESTLPKFEKKIKTKHFKPASNG